MATTTPTAEAITAHQSTNYPIERISRREKPLPFLIVSPDSSWPAQFQAFKAAVQTALGPVALTINHAGSTSVPGLPAKAVLDVDIVVADPTDEAAYVSALVGDGWERTGKGQGDGGVPGLRFLFREPAWNEHRFFVREEDAEHGVMAVNVHLFGPGCPEVLRHQIFREWLIEVSQRIVLPRSI